MLISDWEDRRIRCDSVGVTSGSLLSVKSGSNVPSLHALLVEASNIGAVCDAPDAEVLVHKS